MCGSMEERVHGWSEIISYKAYGVPSASCPPPHKAVSPSAASHVVHHHMFPAQRRQPSQPSREAKPGQTGQKKKGLARNSSRNASPLPNPLLGLSPGWTGPFFLRNNLLSNTFPDFFLQRLGFLSKFHTQVRHDLPL